MRIDVLTLFPEMFTGVLASSILKRAATPTPQRPAPVSYHLTNIRDHSTDKHKKADDSPYGGGPGMVMQCQPLWNAILATESLDPTPATRILTTPQGTPLNQPLVEKLAQLPRLLIIAGHYEGIDERIIQKLHPILEISIGDYVLTGGELPAMVLIDAVVRLLPGALGDQTSSHNDSFSSQSAGLLDYPHYSRPASWMGLDVPPVLLSGDHAKIQAWREQQSQLRTASRRPDLLNQPPIPPNTK